MDMPTKLTEAELWTKARDILHFVGICGAGKSTLSSRLAVRIANHGGKVIGTIDFDPHTPDTDRSAERAFSRALDQRNIKTSYSDPAVHQEIVDHTLGMLTRWTESDANVVMVDRWYESYDNLPREHVKYIEAAIQSSGFRVHHVLLRVEDKPLGNAENAIRERLLHTKGTRPGTWWDSGPDSLEAWVKAEQAYQDEYDVFLQRSPFMSSWVRTTEMDWDRYEDDIVHGLIYRRWKEACNTITEPSLVALEKIMMAGLSENN